jgi:hypothetical protein
MGAKAAGRRQTMIWVLFFSFGLAGTGRVGRKREVAWMPIWLADGHGDCVVCRCVPVYCDDVLATHRFLRLAEFGIQIICDFLQNKELTIAHGIVIWPLANAD